MNYDQFLNQIIEDGIAAAKRDYTRNDQKDKLQGSIDGFNACRNCLPSDLLGLLKTASKYTDDAHWARHNNYWYFRCYQGEIEWVINVVSAACVNENLFPIIPGYPTYSGMRKAAEILGTIDSKKEPKK